MTVSKRGISRVGEMFYQERSQIPDNANITF